MTGRIIEIQSQMHCFDYYFGIYVLQLLLNHSDNLSKALQNSEILACKVHLLAAFSIKILENMCNNIPVILFGTLKNVMQHHWTYQSQPSQEKVKELLNI